MDWNEYLFPEKREEKYFLLTGNSPYVYTHRPNKITFCPFSSRIHQVNIKSNFKYPNQILPTHHILF